MKRSDALQIIKDYLDVNDGKLNADQVLAIVEKLGMAPPLLDEDKCQAIMHVYYMGYTLRQWDEDFEKDNKVVEAYKRRLERQKERRDESIKNEVMKRWRY